MTALRAVAASVTDVGCRALGRRQVVRAARFVLRRACLDAPNEMRTNGEMWLQHQVLNLFPPTQPIRVLDVGANVGDWSAAMLTSALQAGRLDDLDLYAFEPSAYTFARLSEALHGHNVTLARTALGDRAGFATLHVVAPGAGTNSLHESPSALTVVGTEEVEIATVDEYFGQVKLGDVALLKVDAEGHDLAVLRGARGLLSLQRIAILQFEYNHRWIYARTFLRDAFDLLEPFDYRIGKLTRCGVEFYPRWDCDLETFTEGNYVACTQSIAARLPSVKWWKLGDQGEMR